MLEYMIHLDVYNSLLWFLFMEVSYSSILSVMDSLWFQRIVLLAEPISGIYSKTIVQSCNEAEVSDHSEEDCVSATDSFSSSNASQDDYKNELEEEKTLECTAERKMPARLDYKNEVEEGKAVQCTELKERQRPTRLSTVSKKTRSQSSSPSVHRPQKSLSDDGQTLHRFLSCKTLRELEQVELKGFVDLGFQFEKDRLSPRTVNIIPGLQRLREHETADVMKENLAASAFLEGKGDEIENDNRVVVTLPYLSDAWMVKKPDSPLLRLRMARVSTAQEMKNCLKVWVRTVASSINSDL